MVEKVVDIDGERKWTEIIEEARQLADGVTAYCKRKNISKRVYYDLSKINAIKNQPPQVVLRFPVFRPTKVF